jgi:nicotinamidase-related amidase
MNKQDSSLILVDVQKKLTPLVMNAEKIVSRCHWLIRLAQALTVPLLISEQYPSGLGATVDVLSSEITAYEPLEKVHFSCARNDPFMEALRKLSKHQIILAGIETHVCVLQTALDLVATGVYEVFVVVDAVSSRSELDKHYGLKRMQQAGVQLVTSEMVFFEWVKCAGTTAFKSLSREFL